MEEQTIDFRQILEVLLRNMLVICLSIAVCAALALTLAFSLKKQFKSKAVLNIQASYFQNPLVSNLITDVYDPAELKAQRQSLLQQALSSDFIEKLGRQYGVFTTPAGTEQYGLERDLLLKRIEYFSLSPNTFQVSVVAGDRQQAHDMNTAVLERMIATIIKERNDKLLSTRAAIERHISTLGKVLRDAETGSNGSNAEVVKMELEKVESDMALLLQHFTGKHPEIVKLRQQADSLRSRLANMPQKPQQKAVVPAVFMTTAAQRPIREVHDDLLKKLTNIDIVLSIEKDQKNLSYLSVVEKPSVPAAPIFPNKRMFLVFGVLAGVVLAAALVMFSELQRGTFSSPYYISDQLDMPLLGELPFNAQQQSQLLLSDSSARWKSQRLLPQLERVYENQG